MELSLRDKDTFKIKGRGAEDEQRAKILQIMTEYRRDEAFQNTVVILKNYMGVFQYSELRMDLRQAYWDYNAETGKDEPVYPLP